MKKSFSIFIFLILFAIPGFAESNYKEITVNTIDEDVAIIQDSQSGTSTINNTIINISQLFRNSIGKVTFIFDPYNIGVIGRFGKIVDKSSNDNKSCNGFLIKKGEHIYLITVAHLSSVHKDYEFLRKDFQGNILRCRNMDQRDVPINAKLEIPNLNTIQVDIKKDENFFRGDDLPETKQKANGTETLDVSCLDITDKIDSKLIDNFIPYELLADQKDKNEIDNSSSDIILCGYPAKYIKDDFQPDKYQALPCNLIPPRNFGAIIDLSKSEHPGGFYFNAQLEPGDCGRPIIKKLSSKYLVLGLFKTSILLQNNCSLSFANDSTAIIRLIDWAFEHKTLNQE